jgi:hypothetical protein
VLRHSPGEAGGAAGTRRQMRDGVVDSALSMQAAPNDQSVIPAASVTPETTALPVAADS